jgi:hypothetical protein
MVSEIEAAGLQLLSFYLCLPSLVVVFQNSTVSAQNVVYVAHVVVSIGIESVVKLVPAAIITKQLIGTTVKGAAAFFANAFEN